MAMGDGRWAMGDNISLNSITLRVSPSSVCRQQLGRAASTRMREPIPVVVVVAVESLAFKIPHLMCLELHAAARLRLLLPPLLLLRLLRPSLSAHHVVVSSRRLTIFAGFTCKLDLIYCLTLPHQVSLFSPPPPPSKAWHSMASHGIAWHGMAWPAADMACNKILIDVVHLHANCCQLKSPPPTPLQLSQPITYVPRQAPNASHVIERT